MTLSCLSRRCAYLIISGFALGAVQQDAQARLYRWKNEQGKVIYSDQVPPEEAKLKKEALNKSGRVAETIEGEKSKEQWELEKRLEGLRKEQEKIIAKQKSDDKVLLSTFRREEDIRATLDNSLLVIDAQQKVSEGNLLRLEQQLKSLQREAAKYERKGSAVPQNLLDEMTETNQQIAETHKEVERQIRRKEDVTKEFETNIARFNFLTHSEVDAQKLSDESAEHKAADVLGLVGCVSMDQCAHTWQKARTFVQKYSTTPIHVDNDKLIMSSDPRSSADLSLSVSRIERPGYQIQIFLDIRCQKTSLGEELCASSTVRNIRAAFRPFLEAESAAQQ